MSLRVIVERHWVTALEREWLESCHFKSWSFDARVSEIIFWCAVSLRPLSEVYVACIYYFRNFPCWLESHEKAHALETEGPALLSDALSMAHSDSVSFLAKQSLMAPLNNTRDCKGIEDLRDPMTRFNLAAVFYP